MTTTRTKMQMIAILHFINLGYPDHRWNGQHVLLHIIHILLGLTSQPINPGVTPLYCACGDIILAWKLMRCKKNYRMIIEWALVGPSFTRENILFMFLVQRWRT
jgi:hypothetical protein